jgi:hypothetical protein
MGRTAAYVSSSFGKGLQYFQKHRQAIIDHYSARSATKALEHHAATAD